MALQFQIKSNYFIVRLKVDLRAGQLSLPHIGITKTEKIELKHKTDEHTSRVNGLEPYEISPTDRNRLRWRIRFSEKAGFELRLKQ